MSPSSSTIKGSEDNGENNYEVLASDRSYRTPAFTYYDAEITYTPETSGTYYIWVEGIAWNTPYTMSLLHKSTYCFIHAAVNPLHGGSVDGGGYYNPGETVTLIADASQGADFINWTENGQQLSEQKTYTFTAYSNRNLVANFTAQPDIGDQAPTITSVSPASPEVKPTKQPFTIYGDNFETGLEIVITSPGGTEYIIPREENSFIEVTPPDEIEVNAGFTIPGTWQVRVVNPGGQESDNYSFEVKPTAIAAEIDSWSAEPQELEVGDKVTLTMEFTNTGSQNQKFIAGASLWDPDNKKIDFNLNSNPSSDVNPVTLSPGESHTVSWTYTIDQPGGWDVQFAVWKDETGVPANLIVKKPDTKAVDHITAEDKEPGKYTISVSANPSTGGTATVSGDGTFNAGDEVTVIATANSDDDFKFGSWTEDGKVVHEEAEYTFTITSDRNLVANFCTHRVAFIPVRYSDGSITDSSLFYLKKRADWVREYFLRQSYGKVVMLVDFFDEVEIDKPQSGWNSKSESRNSFFEEVLDEANILPENYDFTSDIEAFDAILVISADLGVTPFANIAEYPNILNMAYVEERTTTKNNKSISQFPYAVWAHELGHAMFKWFDYYEQDNYLWTKGSIGYWGIMGKGGYLHPPSPIMSYNKVKAGWLDYADGFLSYGDKRNVPLLHDMQAGDLIHRFKPEQGNIDYFIFEGRYPHDEMCDDMKDHKYEPGSSQRLKEDKGILIYEVREKEHEVSGLMIEHVNVIPFTFPDPLNLQLIQDSKRVTLDPEYFLGQIGLDASYKCDLSEVKFTASLGGEQINLEASKHVPLNRRIISFSLTPYSLLAPYSPAPSISENVVNEFDVNLRVFSEDGLMVGMDYDEGIYRLEIEGARTSGNRMSGSPEWISIPNDIEVDYEIDYTPAGKWLEEVGIGDLSMEASIEIIEVDDQGERTITDEEMIKIELANIILTANPSVGGQLSGDGVFEPGKEVTVTAMASEGYEFVNWTEDGEEVSTEAHYTFTVESGRELIANFAQLGAEPTIYWQNTETGLRYLWFMDGVDPTEMGGIGTFGAGVWNIVGVGDLDGDGKTDIIWHNTETGLLYYWLMDRRSQLDAGGIGIVANLDWRATAVGDMNGNGSPDIIWENTENGRRLVWFMDGVDNVGQELLAEQPDPVWSIVAAADMNGNGQTDLILQNAGEGSREVWLMNDVVKEQKVPFAHEEGLGPQWQIAAAGDLDHSGHNDIVWERQSDGLRYVLFMEGLEDIGGGGLGTISDMNWQIAGLR